MTATYIYTETIPNEDGITIREYTYTSRRPMRHRNRSPTSELADRLGEDFTGDDRTAFTTRAKS